MQLIHTTYTYDISIRHIHTTYPYVICTNIIKHASLYLNINIHEVVILFLLLTFYNVPRICMHTTIKYIQREIQRERWTLMATLYAMYVVHYTYTADTV